MSVDIEFLVQLILSCISLSSLFMVVTIGLTMIFGINRVVNFAHGGIYALGAYFGYTLVRLLGVNFLIALVLAPLLLAVVGLIIEKLFISPIMKKRPQMSLIMTFGILTLLDGLMKLIWGNSPKPLDAPAYLSQTITLAGISYPFYRIFLIIVTVVACGGLLLFLQKTKTGLVMRAASRIPEMVPVLGVNMKHLFSFVFALGCFFGGVGGVLAGPLFTVYPMMGGDMLVNCFIVLVVGGLGSLRGAVWASLIVGTVQTLGYVFFTDFAMAAIFIIMIIILLVMPRGVLGEGRFE